MPDLQLVLYLNENTDPSLVAQIIDLVKVANEGATDPGNGGEEPPVEEEFLWDNNHTMDQAVSEVNGIPVAYLKVKGDEFLWVPDKNNVLTPSQPEEFGSDTRGARTFFKPGQIIVVAKNPKYYKPGATEPDEKVYNKVGLEHINNINSEQRPFPIKLDSGTRAFVVMWEQRIDGRDLREHPDRNRPLFVRAEDVLEVMEF